MCTTGSGISTTGLSSTSVLPSTGAVTDLSSDLGLSSPLVGADLSSDFASDGLPRISVKCVAATNSRAGITSPSSGGAISSSSARACSFFCRAAWLAARSNRAPSVPGPASNPDRGRCARLLPEASSPASANREPCVRAPPPQVRMPPALKPFGRCAVDATAQPFAELEGRQKQKAHQAYRGINNGRANRTKQRQAPLIACRFAVRDVAQEAADAASANFLVQQPGQSSVICQIAGR